MKNVLSLVVAVIAAVQVYAYEPNEKVLKAFAETFSGVQDVKWEDHEEYFTVSFKLAAVRSKVFYSVEGAMLGAIRYYTPELLPLHLLNQLKRQNKSKKLYSVTEVTSGNTVTWFIKLEDDYNWYTLRVEANGDSTWYEKFRKL